MPPHQAIESQAHKNGNKSVIHINDEIRRNLFSKSDSSSSSNLSETSTMVGSKHDSSTSGETGTSSSSWTENPYAKYYLFQLLTVFYLVILVIYGIVLELSGWLIDKKDKDNLKRIHRNSLAFNLYMYIVAFIFIVYCYIMFIFKQRSIKLLWKKAQRKIWKQPLEVDTIRNDDDEHSHALPVVGSFYLRFGALIFAIVACVYYGFSAYYGVFTALDICAIIFTILQTHLLFFSSTMFDEKVYIISCFGTMHLVATNLVTWVQFLFAKNQSTEKSIEKLYKKKKNLGEIVTTTVTIISNFNSDEQEEYEGRRSVNENSRSRIPYSSDCMGLECVFGSFTKIFYTAVVEYSLIAAVVMFIVWHNLGRKKSNRMSHSAHPISPPFPLKRLIFGLIAGLIFVIGTAVSMILFFVNWHQEDDWGAAINFNITDVVHNAIGIAACIFAFWRLRLLDFAHHDPHDPHHDAHANQELLDMILLAIGIIGELAYSIAGLSGICSNKNWNALSVLLTIARVLRIIQSISQSFLIVFASRLKSTAPDRHPGRQTITFLVILNLAMFIYQWFISDKAGTYEGIISLYGEESWAFFVSIFSPLTVFFRFHSSVCFVEIWKHTYANSH